MWWWILDTAGVVAVAGWVWYGFTWLDTRLKAVETALGTAASTVASAAKNG